MSQSQGTTNPKPDESAKAKASPPKTLFVRDTLSFPGQKRMHDVIVSMRNGEPEIKVYGLSSDVGTEMPIEHALKFLKDKAFVVEDAKGNRIEPVPVEKEGGIGNNFLKPDEVIANLSELTTTALFKRVKVTAGSEEITDKASREEMIAFLVKKATPVTSNNSGVAQAMAAAGVDGMSQAEIDKLLEAA